MTEFDRREIVSAAYQHADDLWQQGRLPEARAAQLLAVELERRFAHGETTQSDRDHWDRLVEQHLEALREEYARGEISLPDLEEETEDALENPYQIAS